MKFAHEDLDAWDKSIKSAVDVIDLAETLSVGFERRLC